jgi:hypothetical protein
MPHTDHQFWLVLKPIGAIGDMPVQLTETVMTCAKQAASALTPQLPAHIECVPVL